MSRKCLIFLGMVLCGLLCCGFRWSLVFGDLQWQEVEAEIEEAYPDVVSLTTDTLRDSLDRKEIVLIDVRTWEEFEVSHLPGALLADAVDMEDLPRDAMVVAYCSVGLRSAAFVQTMQNKGFSNIYNLQGSIFEWANRGYPLWAGGKKTPYVHPYNERWGVLLKDDLHSYGYAQ